MTGDGYVIGPAGEVGQAQKVAPGDGAGGVGATVWGVAVGVAAMIGGEGMAAGPAGVAVGGNATAKPPGFS